MKKMRLYSVLAVLSALLFVSCDNDRSDNEKVSKAIVPSAITAKFKGGNTNFKSGDSVIIDISLDNADLSFSQAEVYLNDELYKTKLTFPSSIGIGSKGLPMGRNAIRITASNPEKTESKTASFTVFPANTPKRYTYRVHQVYEHDEKAYTQGLLFHNGRLFEGTGQKALSSLRIVELKDGSVVKTMNLNSSLFGEGIAFLNNEIFQLTWTSQVGFVYNPENLEQQRKFYYAGEGWGLTSDSTYLIRSDGSHKLHFHDAEDFSLIRSIEVYTDEGPVDKLNELEYINGKIFANIYMKNEIAIIDPETGMVEGMLNLKGILSKKYRSKRTDVLNGIAYDAENERIFVTGKYWSKLFEISLLAVEES